MAGTFNLKIISPERIVLDTEVQQLTATARDGELSILPNHEPLVTALGIDILRYTEKGEEQTVSIIGGIMEVTPTQVTILSDAAELGLEIDAARAKQAKERAEAEKTQHREKLDTFQAEVALAKAMARIKAAELANRLKDKRRAGGH